MPNHIVLYQPEIPSNTGNIGRTCAATNTTLHLIHPLGFDTDDKSVRRAGLDYWHLVDIVHHNSLEDFLNSTDGQYYLLTKFGQKNYASLDYSDTSINHYFIFGRETNGLPDWLKEKYKETALRLPMTGQVRSLNLANTAMTLLYEALRQQGFQGLE